MNIPQNIQRAVQSFSEQILIYLVSGVLVCLLSGMTFGLLAGPLMGGFIRMALLHIRTGRAPELGDLAYGFQEFGTLFFYVLVLLLTLAGFFLLILPGVIFSTWWMYALILMVDRKMDYREAMRTSKNRVTEQGGFYSHLGFVTLVFFLPPLAIHTLSALFPPLSLLNLALFPLQALALIHAYEADFGQSSQPLRAN
jgi:cytochrome b561